VIQSTARYALRPARYRDVLPTMNLLREASGWLRLLGHDQWQDPGIDKRRRFKLRMDIAERTVFVVEFEARIVATITVDTLADSDFWQRADAPRSALYAHRMAVTRSQAGRGLGSAMLDWAAGLAVARGRSWLRLDAWVTNDDLHLYYKGLEFDHLRTAYVPGRGSGALFQRPATHRHGGGPVLRPVNLPANAGCGARKAGRRDRPAAPQEVTPGVTPVVA
jgi:GNAT superfamily N-acetyltransferase